MRKINILMCTLFFVLMSACQDQSGFVQEVHPQHVMYTPEGASQLHLFENVASADPLDQLADVVTQILSATFGQITTLPEGQVNAIAEGSAAGLDLIANWIAGLPELDALLETYEIHSAAVAIQYGEEYTLGFVSSVAEAFMENVIMSDDRLVDFDRNLCFDVLQIDQLNAYIAFGACIAGSWETGPGMLVCVGILAAATFANLKKFKDCVRGKN